MARRYGIDLGTTNTVVCSAYFDMDELMDSFSCTPIQFKYETDIPNVEIKASMPSVLFLRKNRETNEYAHIVGAPAKLLAELSNRRNALINTKRNMGEDDKLTVDGLTAKDIATLFLKQCIYAIKASYQRFKTDAMVCITHPAAFTIFANVDTSDAAKLAGLTNASTSLEEPCAALLSFLHDIYVGKIENISFSELCEKQDDKGSISFLVIDIGGGTTDVTIQNIRIGSNDNQEYNPRNMDEYRVSEHTIEFLEADEEGHKSRSHPYHAFGGMDFDFCGVEHIIAYLIKHDEKIKNLSKADMMELKSKLTDIVEKYKITLSSINESRVVDDYIDIDTQVNGVPFHFRLHAKDYFDWVSLLCEVEYGHENVSSRSVYGIIAETVRQSGFRVDQIDYIYVTGGMSYFKPIRDMLKKNFGSLETSKLVFAKDPMNDVAKGAAIYTSFFKIVTPGKILNQSIYLDDPCGEPLTIADEGTKLPIRGRIIENFIKTSNPVAIPINLLCGYGTRDSKLQRLKKMYTKASLDLPTPIGSQIDVEYSIDEDQRLQMELIVHHPNTDYRIPVERDISE